MQQEFRFGPDLGRLAVLKKRVWADYATFENGFFMCSRAYFLEKKKKNIVALIVLFSFL